MLNAGEGFAEFLAEIGGGFVEGLQHLFFARSFDLLAGEGVAGLGVVGFQSDDVIVAEAGDGAGDDGFGVFAEGNFAGQVFGDALIGLAAHEAESVLNFGFGEQVEVGRLLELNGKGLLQSAVENGVAGGIDEFREDYGIFVGERAGVARGEKEAANGDGGEDQRTD